jgi:hypothetical protein
MLAPAIADAQPRRGPPPQTRQAVPVANVSHPGPGHVVGARHYSPYNFYRPYNYGFYGSWYYPYGFSVGFGYGYGSWCCPYAYGYPYAWGYPGFYPGPYYYGPGYVGSSVRLQVSPREAEVYVDGFYAGKVDQFDGTFQRLNVEPGEHELQVFMPGYRSFTQKVYLQPTSTFRVNHAMEPLAAGEPEPTRPVPPPRPPKGGPEPSAGPDRPNSRGPQPPSPRDSGRPRNAESDFGSIAIRIQPTDATITIDGERWEGTPDQDRLVVQLGAGTHTIEIRRDGYRTYITDIDVRRGETTPLNVSLTRQ